MEPLNESLCLGDLPADDRDAFRGEPARVLLTRGARLFRGVTAGKNSPLGPWWVREKTYLLALLRAERIGVTVSQFMRAALAVSFQFSEKLDRVYSATLLRDAWAFEGPAKQQPRGSEDGKTSADRTVLLMGNFPQLWMPRFREGEAVIVPV